LQELVCVSISQIGRGAALISRRAVLNAMMIVPVLWGLGAGEGHNGARSGSPQVAAAADGATVTVMRFSAAGEELGPVQVARVVKSDAQWRRQLTPAQYWVTRQGRDEPAFAGLYTTFRGRGIYSCVCCGNALFGSETKYDAGTGWPSFWAPLARENIWTRPNRAGSVEVLCRRCDAHLGELYHDGPPPTRQRYSVDSAALVFVAADAA
jgi:peptide-methionine (R)-S-oxide reductase